MALPLAALLVVVGYSSALAATVSVTATVETQPVPGTGDAADDAAVWLHPSDLSLSTVIGTDKSRDGHGLAVYDLSGKQLYFYPDGRMNNVDVRYNFPLGGASVALVGVTNRERSIDFYQVNVADRSLTKVGSFLPTSAIATPRGISLYHSPVSGEYYAFVTDLGNTEQYRLDGSTGSVRGTLVRSIKLASPTEGLVTDDEMKRLYIAQENVGGIWRFGAEPSDPTIGTRVVATTENGGDIVQDIKGLALYYRAGGAGYLLAASQGASKFHVYDRVDNRTLGSFAITSGVVDGVTGEDGIDVTNAGLGSRFPNGMFLSQDHSNEGGGNQNFKLVPWESIAGKLSLAVDTSLDPRRIGAGTTVETTLISAPPQSTDSTSASFEFMSNASGATFECALDGGGYAGCASPKAYTGLGVGTHTFAVRASAGGSTDPSPATYTWTVSAPPTAPTSLLPTEDAHTDSAYPSTNFGSAASLGSDASPAKVAYLKFDLRGVAATSVGSARLRMYVTNGSTAVNTVRSTTASWSESTITSNTRPPLGTALATVTPKTAGAWVEADVSAAINAGAGTVLALGIDTASADGYGFSSSEATANRVELRITPPS